MYQVLKGVWSGSRDPFSMPAIISPEWLKRESPDFVYCTYIKFGDSRLNHSGDIIRVNILGVILWITDYPLMSMVQVTRPVFYILPQSYLWSP